MVDLIQSRQVTVAQTPSLGPKGEYRILMLASTEGEQAHQAIWSRRQGQAAPSE